MGLDGGDVDTSESKDGEIVVRPLTNMQRSLTGFVGVPGGDVDSSEAKDDDDIVVRLSTDKQALLTGFLGDVGCELDSSEARDSDRGCGVRRRRRPGCPHRTAPTERARKKISGSSAEVYSARETSLGTRAG